MKIRSLAILSLACSLASLGTVRAEDAKPPAAAAPAKPAAHEETELEGKMDVVGGAFRKLRRQVTDASKNADSLALVAKMKAAAEEALTLVPARAADVPEAERAKFAADYQAKMKTFLGEIGKLEAAFKADKNEEAGKILAELNAMQKDGHKQFKRADKK